MKKTIKESIDRRPKRFFETELQRILYIHFEAKYYFKDVEYILKPSSIEEQEESKNIFINRLLRAYWRLGIIEIAKLFVESKNQHFNLINYLEELIEFYDEYEWLKNIPKNKIQSWLDRINSENFKNLRGNIIIQRNNYFAHTDRQPKKELSKAPINLNEINQLLIFTEEIIFELKLKCLQVDCDFEISGTEKAGNILEALIALREKREMKINEEMNELLKEKLDRIERMKRHDKCK